MKELTVVDNKKKSKKKKQPVSEDPTQPQKTVLVPDSSLEKRSLLPKDLYAEIQALKKRVSDLESKIKSSLD